MHEDPPYLKRSVVRLTRSAPAGTMADKPTVSPGVRRLDSSQSYDGFRTKVASMLDEGVALKTIERTVDAYPLDSEHRAALWLLANASDNQPTGPRRGDAALGAKRIGRVVRGTGRGVRA